MGDVSATVGASEAVAEELCEYETGKVPLPGPVCLPGEASADSWSRFLKQREWTWMVVGPTECYERFCKTFEESRCFGVYASSLIVYLLQGLRGQNEEPPPDVERAFAELADAIEVFLAARPEKGERK